MSVDGNNKLPACLGVPFRDITSAAKREE